MSDVFDRHRCDSCGMACALDNEFCERCFEHYKRNGPAIQEFTAWVEQRAATCDDPYSDAEYAAWMATWTAKVRTLIVEIDRLEKRMGISRPAGGA